MKKYITFVSFTYQAKNKLEKSILDFIKVNDRLLIDEKNLKIFTENILQHIQFLNQENKRCAPKNPSWNSGLNKDLHMSGVDVISFYIYEIKSEYEIS